MGDYTNLTMRVSSNDPRVLTAARDAMQNYSGTFTYLDEAEGDELSIGVNEAPCGSAGELASALDDLFTKADNEIECGFCKGEGCENCDDDGVVLTKLPDFAYYVWEDPKYEYLGTVHIHVPGVGDFTGSCDSDGTPVIDAAEIAQKVAAATDLTALKAEIAQVTGGNVPHAYGEYVAPKTTEV